MIDYRFNKITKEGVIVSSKRAKRPDNNKIDSKRIKKICPFCPGNENLTPPEVYRIGEGQANKSGWKVRVIPNKFKITDIHEIIIHSPYEDLDLEDFDLDQIKMIFEVYRQRFNFYRKKGNVIIFDNTGRDGGESLQHDHSQLTLVPFNIKISVPKIGRFENIAFENEFFTVFCPSASSWPYEVWFVPKRRRKYFGDISDKEILIISSLLKQSIKIIENEVGEYAYNYYIYPKKDWYLRLIPRISMRAGFELATGIMVNTKDPKEVSELLNKKLKV